MVAFITSTLRPTNIHSIFSDEQRYEQTIITIKKLRERGFDDIYLFDNSANGIDAEKIKKDSYRLLKIYSTAQYSFKNKGLNEALLILNNIIHLPPSTPLFKISGRYYPTENFDINTAAVINQYDFIGVGENFNKSISAFSTRAYFVKDKAVLEQTLIMAIEEMLSYHKGIYGPLSALKFIRSYFKPVLGSTYQLSIEQAFARILKQKHNYLLLKKINIAGTLAGFNDANSISE